MSHVVMQAAELPSVEDAKRVEGELLALVERYAEFEKTDADPWGGKTVPGPLSDFGARYGVAWPLEEQSRFLLKGLFPDVVSVVQVERMVFFYGGGFDLGGETLRAVLQKMGAVGVAGAECHLVIHVPSAEARAAELASFLEDEDYDDQFEVSDVWADSLFSITIEDGETTRCLLFDDSGVQDWAFVALLPQLEGDQPALRVRAAEGG